MSYQDSDEDDREKAAFRSRLLATAFYPTLIKQLTTKELVYFEDQWIEWVRQFRGNVQHSEEEALKHRIMNDININRIRVKQMQAQNNFEANTILINKAKKKVGEDRDWTELQRLGEEIAFDRSVMESLSKEEIEYQKQIEKTDKALKARREDRIKTIKESQDTFMGLLMELEDEERRERHGIDMEIHRLAKEQAKKELSEEHLYIDKKHDIPFFTPEVAEKIDVDDMPRPY